MTDIERRGRTLHNWLSDNGALIGFLGLIVGVVAVIIAIRQNRKSASATEAAEEAGREAMAKMRNGFLLILIPQLGRIESGLDSAVRSSSHSLIADHLLEWPYYAGQLRGLLDDDEKSTKIKISIQDSIALAARARVYMSTEEINLTLTMQEMQSAVAAVTAELGELSMNYTKGR